MITWLRMLIDLVMPRRWYISNSSVEHGTEAFFGPFYKWEIEDRLEDDYALLLEYDGDDLCPVKFKWTEARKLFPLNSREYWIEQNEALYEECDCGGDGAGGHYHHCATNSAWSGEK